MRIVYVDMRSERVMRRTVRPTALEGDGNTKRSKSLSHRLGAAEEVRNAAYGVKPVSRDSTCRSDAYAACDKLVAQALRASDSQACVPFGSW